MSEVRNEFVRQLMEERHERILGVTPTAPCSSCQHDVEQLMPVITSFVRDWIDEYVTAYTSYDDDGQMAREWESDMQR